MKLIIDIPEETYKWIRDNYENPYEEIAYDVIKKGKPCEEQKQGDLISRRDIKDHIGELILVYSGEELTNAIINAIDNSPAVEYPFYQEAYQTGYEEGKNERTKGDCENCDFRKFSETFVDGVVEVMNKNGITTLEQLSEILKGGAE